MSSYSILILLNTYMGMRHTKINARSHPYCIQIGGDLTTGKTKTCIVVHRFTGKFIGAK